MTNNNMDDVMEVYKSLLKYFDSKGYIVIIPDGKIQCVEVSDSPTNNVEISLSMNMKDARKNQRGTYDVHGKSTFSLAITEGTDHQFADQIMKDMKYFLEHFNGTVVDHKV